MIAPVGSQELCIALARMAVLGRLVGHWCGFGVGNRDRDGVFPGWFFELDVYSLGGREKLLRRREWSSRALGTYVWFWSGT